MKQSEKKSGNIMRKFTIEPDTKTKKKYPKNKKKVTFVLKTYRY